MMAKFNPDEVILSQNQPNSAKFNPDEVMLSQDQSKAANLNAGTDSGSLPNQEFRNKLFEGIKQGALSAGDFAKGVASGTQNTGAYATSFLPQSMQIPRYDPKPTSTYGKFPIEAGKLGTSLLAALLTEGASLPAMEAAGVPAALARVAASTAGGAVSAPSVDASPETGAALGFAGSAIPEAAMSALGKYIGRNVTPAQFAANRAAVPENIKSPIGELADSPRAKTRYGKARGVALSQADAPYQQLYDHLKEGVSSLTADAPTVANPSQYVYDDVAKSYESAMSDSKKDYEKLGEYADSNDVPFDRTDLDGQIDSSIKEINKKVKNKTSKKLYSESLATLEDFKEDRLPPSFSRPESFGAKINTFGDAVAVRPALNDLIAKASRKDDKQYVRYLEKIKDGLDASIEKSSMTGDPKLFELHKIANNSRIHQGTYEKLNRSNKTPFYNIYVKGGTPDNLIGSHIRTGTKGDDPSGILAALTEKLSPNAKAVLAKAHLQPQEDTSLAKQISKIKKLSPTQRDLMFGDKAPTANSIAKISGLYPSAASADFTPKTGFTGSKLIQLLTEVSGLSSGVAAGAATHSPGLVAGSLAAAGFLPATGQLTQRALRSEALKNAHMRYLQNAGKKALTKSTPAGKALQTGLISQGGNQNGA